MLRDDFEKPIISFFLENVEKFPNKIATYAADLSVTYMELALYTKSLISELNDMRLARGDNVAVLMPNCIEFQALLLAASYLELVLVPLPSSAPRAAIEKTISLAGCTKIIVMNSSLFSDVPLGSEILKVHAFGEELESYRGWLKGGAKKFPVDFLQGRIININNPYIISATSGSTGNPKLIALSQKNKILRIFLGAADLYSLNSNDVILVGSPMYHSLGMRLSILPLLIGGSAVIMTAFTIDEWLHSIEKYQITFTIAISSQLCAISNFANFDLYNLKSLKALVSSSASLELGMKKVLVEKFGCSIFECYGASEIGIATTLNLSTQLNKYKTVGRPLSYVDIRIEAGEILVKTDTIFNGYYSQVELTNQSFKDGYFKTGDLGRLDEDGYLYYLGRSKDLIITGGINVYPGDVEKVIMRAKGVIDVAVVGIPDEYFGEAVIAVIQALGEVSKLEIQNLCSRELADFQRPLAYIFIDELPKSELGKIKKGLLREQYKNLDASKRLRSLLIGVTK